MVDPKSTMPFGFEIKTQSSRNEELKKNFTTDLLNKYLHQDVEIDNRPSDGLKINIVNAPSFNQYSTTMLPYSGF